MIHMDEKMITIIDENGNEQLHEILLTFELDDYDKQYVVFAPVGNEGDEDEDLDEELIGRIAENYTFVDIKNVDVQCCYALKDYDKDGLSPAEALLKTDKIEEVYACYGISGYNYWYNFNTSLLGIYRLEKNSAGKPTPHFCGFATTILFWEK